MSAVVDDKVLKESRNNKSIKEKTNNRRLIRKRCTNYSKLG
jgi:hypothetical protein